MPYKIVKGPTSDVKFEATGANLNELFASAAEAVCSVLSDIKKVKAVRSVHAEVKAKDEQDLLFDWLSQVIALVDIEGMFFSRFEVDVAKDGRSLKAKCFGDDAKPENSLTVVKSVTYHDFSLKKAAKGYKATVVLDI
jgi:SHS2 domain-containing protein